MCMRKMFAALLSVALLGVSSLPVSAYWVPDDNRADDGFDIICVVTAVREDGCYFLDDNIVLYQSDIDKYAEEPFTPSCGDVVQIKNISILTTAPAQIGGIPSGATREIEYLGKAEDYFEDTIAELTVLSNDGFEMTLEDAEQKQYKFVYYAGDDRGYVALGYHADINCTLFEPGDKGLFVVLPEEEVRFLEGPQTNRVMVAVSGPIKKTLADVSAPDVTAPETIIGDTDGNGSVDILDVVTANKIILGKYKATDAEYEAADVDGNGVVEPADSLNIMKLVVGLEVNF